MLLDFVEVVHFCDMVRRDVCCGVDGVDDDDDDVDGQWVRFDKLLEQRYVI